MSQILQNQTLEMTNVLSRRGKFTQTELQLEMQNIGIFFKENGIEKNGNIVTATFAVDSSSGIMDVEILVPMNRETSLSNGYTFKSIFKLTNAVKIRHIGNPAFLQKSANEMTEHISTDLRFEILNLL